MPERLLDLHAEFRCHKSGLLPPGDYGIEDALKHLGVGGEGLADNPLNALAKLLEAMTPEIDLPRALMRGRYTAAVARMEAVGVPVDLNILGRLRENWDGLRDALIEEIDQGYDVFRDGKFRPDRWSSWLNRMGIPWPRTAGELILEPKTFKEMARAFPQVRPMKELMATLNLLKPSSFPVGRDGRNRTPLRPFASKTGRNRPSSSNFIFGQAAWVRGLIKPQEGTALAYLDYEQQEFGIAAALSGDHAMMEAYNSGDPYLSFAKQAGAVPREATKNSHREVRERFKQCALGVQYCMSAWGLSERLGIKLPDAKRLVRLHQKSYRTYWRWSEAVEREAREKGSLQACFGWLVHKGTSTNGRSMRNFPLQANGAEMLRLACTVLTEKGVRVCAPVHDALLVEAPLGEIDEVVSGCRRAMAWASQQVLGGFPLRAEAKIVRYPERYMEKRGEELWNKVMKLIG
jgi:hypothetical protein